jgi:mRNA interferase MazF
VICERCDIAVIPFPFAEIPVLKRRPVVVMSGSAFNSANKLTLVAVITSSKQLSWPSDAMIQDLHTAGLRVDCIVRWRLATVPNDQLVRRLGQFGSFDRLACERRFANLIS